MNFSYIKQITDPIEKAKTILASSKEITQASLIKKKGDIANELGIPKSHLSIIWPYIVVIAEMQNDQSKK